MSEASYIVGEVLTTFFENAQNFYKVLLVRVIESDCVSVDDEKFIRIFPIVLTEKLSLIQNTENSFKRIIINKHNLLEKEALFNIFQALIFQGLVRKQPKKLLKN